jgi:5-methylcytosine-specific restriction endonuclease McrA
MWRRCLRCRTLIATGSYCNAHKPRPTSPGRVTGRRLQETRARVLAAYGHKCARCGVGGVALEVHHVDHNHLNNAPANLVPLCRSCHGKALPPAA